jgi:hypothetical protein
MNYSTYIPDSDKWIRHFTSKSDNFKRKNGVILLNKSVQRGDGNIELISPDTALVERASASMKRKRVPIVRKGVKRRKSKGRKGGGSKKKNKKKRSKKSSHSKKKPQKRKK